MVWVAMAHFMVVDKFLEGHSVTLRSMRRRSNAELNTAYGQEYHLNIQKVCFYIVQCCSYIKLQVDTFYNRKIKQLK